MADQLWQSVYREPDAKISQPAHELRCRCWRETDSFGYRRGQKQPRSWSNDRQNCWADRKLLQPKHRIVALFEAAVILSIRIFLVAVAAMLHLLPEHFGQGLSAHHRSNANVVSGFRVCGQQAGK